MVAEAVLLISSTLGFSFFYPHYLSTLPLGCNGKPKATLNRAGMNHPSLLLSTLPAQEWGKDAREGASSLLKPLSYLPLAIYTLP